jgi:hypothetical protein
MIASESVACPLGVPPEAVGKVRRDLELQRFLVLGLIIAELDESRPATPLRPVQMLPEAQGR